MKKQFLYLMCFFCTIQLLGQTNLVINGGFEAYSSCPTFGTQWNLCNGWNNLNSNQGGGPWGTPDYFRACGTGGTAPPATFAGTCNPHGGNAMMALVVYNVPYPEYREYLGTKLLCPMAVGKTYTVSFWISNGTGVKSPWTIKNFGINFSTSPLTQTGWGLINLTPQCEINTNIVSTNWTQYTFAIIPTAAWEYLSIGVFSPDANNNTTQSFPNLGGPASVYANYFIDDISVLADGGIAGLSISSSPSSTICANQSATLSVSGTNSYTWSNGTVGSNIVVTPTASIEFTVSAPASACSAGTNSIRLEVVPEASVSSFKSICYGQIANIKGQVSNIQVLGQNPTNTNGVVSPTASTIYTVQIANSSGTLSCWATQTVQVNVNPNPEADFKYNINSCGGGVQFTDLSSSEIANWYWTIESNKTFTIQNPYYFFNQGGLYTVTLTANNIYGCANTSLKTFSVSNPPPVSINTSSHVCKGKSVQLNASGGNAYEWRPTQYLDFPNVSNPLSKAETNITYSVIITTQYHNTTCELMLTTSVQVDELSSHKPYVTTSTHTVSIGEAADLKYNGDAGAFVSWLPPTTPVFGYQVKAFPEKNTIYRAIANKGACIDTFYININAFTTGCLMEDVFVPNTFTPNNDGKNDKLFVRGAKIDQLQFSIYNRWGEKVFETNDIQEGWDGTYNTSPLDAGVFGWQLKVQCINGGEVFLKGNVSLVR